MEKIAVLMGGLSNEREVSLESGKNVVEGLRGLGRYDVVPVILDAENLDALPDGIDRAYIALHGGWGENGGVQAALNARGIPYTGPGVYASQLAMNKIKTKMALEMKGVPTAPWAIAGQDTAESPLPLPVVVKPPCDGSSVGITKVTRGDEWQMALECGFAAIAKSANREIAESEDLLVEAYVPGREFTVPVLNGEAWSVIEIVAKDGWYGYEEKYNSTETRYPFFEDPILAPQMQRLAVDAYRACECRGITRIDFRMNGAGEMFVLELNTSPGFTSHSLVPKAGMHTGLTFGEVCEKILKTAAID